MLKELVVLNGELTPKFDKYNNTYTVRIANEVDRLELTYIPEDNTIVSIFGNDNLRDGENIVIISLANKDQYEYIYLNVIKNQSDEVFSYLKDESSTIEVPNSITNYGGPLIILSCFLLIMLLFILLFCQKGKRKKMSHY